MGVFAQQLLDGKPMTINGDGEQRRDFTYVGDVVDANIKCATTLGFEFNGEVFNIGANDNRSVNDVANLLGGDSINNPPVLEPRQTRADNSKAKKILNWKTTQNFEEWVNKWKKELGL